MVICYLFTLEIHGYGWLVDSANKPAARLLVNDSLQLGVVVKAHKSPGLFKQSAKLVAEARQVKALYISQIDLAIAILVGNTFGFVE